MKIAIFTRTSTDKQTCENQVILLKELAEKNNDEVVRIYEETASAVSKKRSVLNEMLEDARKRKFEKIYILSFDRLSRSVKHLIETVQLLKEYKVDLYIHRENIDTNIAIGEFMMNIFGSLYQLERELIVERIKLGLNRAKKNGKKLGRKTVMNDDLRYKIIQLRKKNFGILRIAKQLKIGTSTVYNALG